MKPLLPFALLICSTALGFSARNQNWPQFRGPSGQGLSLEKNLPQHWSASSNVAWRVSIPGEGWSSPIVWGDNVFVTTALQDGVAAHVFCLNLENGDVRWNVKVCEQSTSGRKEGRNTFATPTPATDGELVYSVFFDGAFIAQDFSGKVVWMNKEHSFYSQHGLGTSPIVWGDLLIMARDGSSQGANKKIGWQEPWDESYVFALDKRTGKQKWKTVRLQSRIGHSVPIVYTNGVTPMLLSAAGDVVQAMNAASGEKLWTASSKGEGVVPSPAAGDGLVFTACGFSGRDSIKAFRVDAQGNPVTNNMVWERRQGMPRVPSLLYASPLLFVISDNGQLQCLAGATGEVLGQRKLDGNYSASPVHADGTVYLLSDDGTTTVVEAAPSLRVVATNPLGEKTQASMAVSDGQLLIRGEKHLFCIREQGRQLSRDSSK